MQEALNAAREGVGAAAALNRRWESRFARMDGTAAPVVAGKQPSLYDSLLEPPVNRRYEGGRVIIFFIGGVTQSEIAAIERVSMATKREIIIGCTSMITPKDFFEQLYDIDRPVGDEDIDAAGAFPALDIKLDD
jgi:hypothetical protein